MKDLNYRSLVASPIAEGATTPNLGTNYSWAWSTTLNKPVYWNGTIWTAGSAGGGTGNVTGAPSSEDNTIALFDGVTGKAIKSSPKLKFDPVNNNYRQTFDGTLTNPYIQSTVISTNASTFVYGLNGTYASFAAGPTSANITINAGFSEFDYFLAQVSTTGDQIVGLLNASSQKIEYGLTPGSRSYFQMFGGSGGTTSLIANVDVANVTLTSNKLLNLSSSAAEGVTVESVNFKSGKVNLPVLATEPATPAAGNLALYTREILPGRTVLKVKRPSGVDSPIQDAIAFNRLHKWQASGASLVASGAGALTTLGTLAAGTFASGTAVSSCQRVRISSTATAGNIAQAYVNNANLAPVMRGAVAGQGGFLAVFRFNLAVLAAGNRGFVGLLDVITAPTNVDPTTNATPGSVGLAFNANTGNWRLVNNVSGTARTSLDLGANFPINTTDLMELVLFCRPHDGTSTGNISYRVRRYTTTSSNPAFETTGTLTTNIPAATTLLHPSTWMTNNATAAAVAYEINSIAIESDW